MRVLTVTLVEDPVVTRLFLVAGANMEIIGSGVLGTVVVAVDREVVIEGSLTTVVETVGGLMNTDVGSVEGVVVGDAPGKSSPPTITRFWLVSIGRLTLQVGMFVVLMKSGARLVLRDGPGFC